MDWKAATTLQLCVAILDDMATEIDIEKAGNELYKRLQEGKGHEMQG
ncbi:hypothetical protein M5X04_14595 [Paenibacillus alvei]|uniref:Uncharacterized protein n=1 Tax=Paenibacillus alvei TaxID=44250 RepID=A0ABT4E9X7_PAEAL|nr:hypothetical protein [Paenibacillus alvei]MCY9530548.1 hypothetical protein [Paenibacillus alvei]